MSQHPNANLQETLIVEAEITTIQYDWIRYVCASLLCVFVCVCMCVCVCVCVVAPLHTACWSPATSRVIQLNVNGKQWV